MKWLPRFLLLGLFAFTSGLAWSAPAPAAPAPDYYPLKVGTKWHFVGEANGKTVRMIFQVAEEETIDGVKLARIETVVDGRTVGTEHLQATEKGLFRHRFNGVKIVPPVCLMRYPVKDGEKWETAITIGSEKATLKTTIGKGDAEVPAGKFQAVTVRIDGETNGKALTTTYWLVDGRGLVKQQVEIGELNITMKLEKAEPAK